MASTAKTFGNIYPNVIPFVQDGIAIGDSDFKLVINN
jgi:hypothetical protein